MRSHLPYLFILPDNPEAPFKLAQMGLTEGVHYQSAKLAREYKRDGSAVPFISWDNVTVIMLPFTASEGPSYQRNNASIRDLYANLIAAFTFYEVDNERRWTKWAKGVQDEGPPFAYDIISSGTMKPLDEVVGGASEWITLPDGRSWALAPKAPKAPPKDGNETEFERWSSYGVEC